MAVTGTPKQAKGAIRCLYVNVYKSKNDIFDDIVEVNLFIIASILCDIYHLCFIFRKLKLI